MKIVAFGLLVGLLGAGLFGHAEEPRLGLRHIEVECDGEKCTLSRDALLAIHQTNLQLAAELDEALKRLKALSESKGCAKVEVLPKKTAPGVVAPGTRGS